MKPAAEPTQPLERPPLAGVALHTPPTKGRPPAIDPKSHPPHALTAHMIDTLGNEVSMVNLASPTSSMGPSPQGGSSNARPGAAPGEDESEEESDVDSYSDDFEVEHAPPESPRRLEPKMSLAISRAGSIKAPPARAESAGGASGEEMPLSGTTKQSLLEKHGPMLEPYTERVVAFVRDHRGTLDDAAMSERLMAMVPKEKHSALFNVFLALHAMGA